MSGFGCLLQIFTCILFLPENIWRSCSGFLPLATRQRLNFSCLFIKNSWRIKANFSFVVVVKMIGRWSRDRIMIINHNAQTQLFKMAWLSTAVKVTKWEIADQVIVNQTHKIIGFYLHLKSSCSFLNNNDVNKPTYQKLKKSQRKQHVVNHTRKTLSLSL